MAAPQHDWYFKEWLQSCKKKQKDIVNDLGWNKAKVSLMWHGKQAYTREEINEIAAYLNIRPHELLMHPDDAHAIRRLKADMIRLAHENEEPVADHPQKKVSRH
jgi:DNA-binding Xre family transcriptional regulator